MRSAMGKPPISSSVPAGDTCRPPGKIAVAPCAAAGSAAPGPGAPALQLDVKVEPWLQPETRIKRASARERMTFFIALDTSLGNEQILMPADGVGSSDPNACTLFAPFF